MTEISPSQILVVRLSSVGDVLLATPLVRALRRAYPGARLRFLVKPAFADLVRFNPHLDEVLLWPGADGAKRVASGLLSSPVWALAVAVRAGGPLWVVDLQASPRSLAFAALLRAERWFTYRKDYLRRGLLVHAKVDRYPWPPRSIAERYFEAVAPLALVPDGRGLELVVGEEARWRALEVLGAREPPAAGETQSHSSPFSTEGRESGWLAVAPGARWATKRWPPESFAAAARRIATQGGWRVAVLGSGADSVAGGTVADLLATSGIPAVDLTGRLSLLESAAVLGRCRLLLANDSGLMHVAAALGVPTVALFGSTVPQFGFAPYVGPSRVLGVSDLPCRPCTHIGRAACPLGHFRCMRDLSPEQVARAALELLAGEAGPATADRGKGRSTMRGPAQAAPAREGPVSRGPATADPAAGGGAASVR